MIRANRPHRKEQRHQEALERQAAYDLLTDDEKAARDEAWKEAHA